MEFYATARAAAPASFLHRHVTVGNMARLCASVDKVLVDEGERGEVYCPWGQFRVHREVLRDGVRFSMPGCESALQWSITAARRDVGCVIVHLTLNRPEHDADFVEVLAKFVDDWREGLEQRLVELRAASAPKPGLPSVPWYG